MKTPEDEAFDDLAKRQGAWGGGFPAKRQMAADKLRDCMHGKLARSCQICDLEAEVEELKAALAQPAQEPVAMKFKIYKPTVPDPMRQGINNALLPWVYDQDRNSGFDATMWVTPVATLPPQRTWVGLTDEDCKGMSAGDKVVAMWANRILKERNS